MDLLGASGAVKKAEGRGMDLNLELILWIVFECILKIVEKILISWLFLLLWNRVRKRLICYIHFTDNNILIIVVAVATSTNFKMAGFNLCPLLLVTRYYILQRNLVFWTLFAWRHKMKKFLLFLLELLLLLLLLRFMRSLWLLLLLFNVRYFPLLVFESTWSNFSCMVVASTA